MGIALRHSCEAKTGRPRDSVYIQLEEEYYVRNHDWKLDQARQLFDMHDAPHRQLLVDSAVRIRLARAARK